ncbi:hypothetical protein HYPSUDRAFT_199268 [Hypholoma sublateritium FD-334 SS-4]|uniref:Uncharacterized protein n=1 Tax=Hypholoma sublateritium (strain FD-334 SS-4) TaxID=945553 RepID=A0A0D2LES6_HYPSF|nr:hypothetical protein HYPSUDRAFT_199268 [Hypholoma sublateritium FD-334 SS-4]
MRHDKQVAAAAWVLMQRVAPTLEEFNIPESSHFRYIRQTLIPGPVDLGVLARVRWGTLDDAFARRAVHPALRAVGLMMRICHGRAEDADGHPAEGVVGAEALGVRSRNPIQRPIPVDVVGIVFFGAGDAQRSTEQGRGVTSRRTRRTFLRQTYGLLIASDGRTHYAPLPSRAADFYVNQEAACIRRLRTVFPKAPRMVQNTDECPPCAGIHRQHALVARPVLSHAENDESVLRSSSAEARGAVVRTGVGTWPYLLPSKQFPSPDMSIAVFAVEIEFADGASGAPSLPSGSEYYASKKFADMDERTDDEEPKEEEPPEEVITTKRGRRAKKMEFVESSDNNGEGEDDPDVEIPAQDLLNESSNRKATRASTVKHHIDEDKEEDSRSRGLTRAARLNGLITPDDEEPRDDFQGYSPRNRTKRLRLPLRSREQRIHKRNAARMKDEDYEHSSGHDMLGFPGEPEREPEPEDAGDGKPYSLRQRKNISYAILAPLEESVKATRQGGKLGVAAALEATEPKRD